MIYVIIVLILLVVYFLITYNKLVKLNNQLKEAFSTMDVFLKKRWDLIPSIVETVKGYAKHEMDTLEGIVEARNNYNNMTTEEKIDKNNSINDNIPKLFALAEAYPKLKANENFMDLSKQLKAVEDDIANSRKYYNGAVKVFNNKVEMFPSNIVASLLGYKSQKMFSIDSSERENVKIDLDK